MEKECDVWSLGIIMYILVYKQFPFTNSGDLEVLKGNILNMEAKFPTFNKNECFLVFSDKCIDLIKKMLTKDYKERID